MTTINKRLQDLELYTAKQDKQRPVLRWRDELPDDWIPGPDDIVLVWDDDNPLEQS